MNAELIAVGTELLLGQIINTNARYLSERLAELGINVYFHTVAGDNRVRLLNTLAVASDRVDLVITTGGLGPTGDDLTKETLAEYLNLPLEIVPAELERLKELFLRRRLPWVDNNAKQAAFLKGSFILKNDRGTAPGLAFKHQGKAYILLPGPPREMEHMFYTYAIPWLQENLLPPNTAGLHSKVLKFLGISESKLAESLEDILAAQQEVTIAPLAKTGGEIHLRLTTKAVSQQDFLAKIQPALAEIKKQVGKYLVAEDEESPSQALGELLKEKGLTVSTAESCTGGLLSASLTSVPGSSSYYLGSVIAYSNEMKNKMLAIPQALIEEKGAVSAEVASLLAGNIRTLTGSSIGLGITGVAGPDGGTPDKPVGLVYIALSSAEFTWCQGYNFLGDRHTIRLRSVNTALNLVRKFLHEEHEQ